MTKKRIFVAILSLLLTLGCLCSCSALRNFWESLLGENRTLVSFSEITYARPNFASLDQKIDEMSKLLKSGSDEEAKMTSLLEEIVTAYYYDTHTMGNLAFVLFSKDFKNERLRNEYYEILSETDRLASRLEELYFLCAESDLRDTFESKIMGEGFFDAYEGGSFTYPEEFLSLLERESALLMDYSTALSEISVEYDGTVYTEEEIDAITDATLYRAVCQAYYDKYNVLLGEIFVELVSVRQQIADYCGYSGYAEYAFENLYAREYSVAQAKRYLNSVKTHLVPVYRAVTETFTFENLDSLPTMPPKTTAETAGKIIGAMSQDLGEIYGEMLDKGLYTVAASRTMYYGSFQTYFNNYESPYLFVNGSGQISDLLTVVHEFGHFASAYYNYGSTGSNDESEVASQGLELMSLRYLDAVLGAENADALRTYELYGILGNLTECAAYTAFEDLVYADKTPTLAECNEYFLRCATEYGLANLSQSGLGDGQYWVFINHLIEYPYYMIGYSVSADVAVQLYELGKEEGMETYLELIQLAFLYNFFGNLETVGLESPFSDGRAEAIASFFRREYNLSA